MQGLERLLAEWLQAEHSAPVVRLDATEDDPTYSAALDGLVTKLSEVLQGSRRGREMGPASP